MLNVNPKLLDRLEEIETDLLARRERADAGGWIGEIEGIDLTLTFLHAKRDEAERQGSRSVVSLGIPSLPPRRRHEPEQ
ncbi:recombinase [Nonomuraea sp. NPDC000554]|uniref:recombinase n=1 Tax=Nonomuraea sp. NPDC000554 TaxID=3154259 RepID=UPI0033338036